MDNVARMTTAILFCFVIAWVGSYVSFRWHHGAPGGFVTQTVVTYPSDQPMLIKVFEPLAQLDASLTGTTSQVEG